MKIGSKNYIPPLLAAIGVAITIFFLTKIDIDWSLGRTPVAQKQREAEKDRILKSVISDRANLSWQLNELQKKHQQLICQNQNNTGVSETGGWCVKTVMKSHLFDHFLADAVGKFLQNKAILSLGDGPGEYKRWLLEKKFVKVYDSYDGSPFCEESTNGSVKFIDLTLQHFWLPEYDWVVSLEVIEHIPAKYESVVLNNIIRPAREGIVISWAIPNQVGFQHVNPRDEKYVMERLAGLGFTLDVNATGTMRAAAWRPWFKTNTNVFRRTQL